MSPDGELRAVASGGMSLPEYLENPFSETGTENHFPPVRSPSCPPSTLPIPTSHAQTFKMDFRSRFLAFQELFLVQDFFRNRNVCMIQFLAQIVNMMYLL